MSIETEEYTLPSNWASALVNGDDSGLEEEESKAVNAFVARIGVEGWHIVSTKDMEDDTDFVKFHDAEPEYPFATDCLVFIAHRQVKDKDETPKNEGKISDDLEDAKFCCRITSAMKQQIADLSIHAEDEQTMTNIAQCLALALAIDRVLLRVHQTCHNIHMKGTTEHQAFTTAGSIFHLLTENIVRSKFVKIEPEDLESEGFEGYLKRVTF